MSGKQLAHLVIVPSGPTHRTCFEVTGTDFHSHLTLLLSVFRYSFSYITFNYYSRWAQFSYRLAFIAAAATYGIVVYKAHKARFLGSKQPPPKAGLWALISDENVQYLCK